MANEATGSADRFTRQQLVEELVELRIKRGRTLNSLSSQPRPVEEAFFMIERMRRMDERIDLIEKKLQLEVF